MHGFSSSFSRGTFIMLAYPSTLRIDMRLLLYPAILEHLQHICRLKRIANNHVLWHRSDPLCMIDGPSQDVMQSGQL